ncbi:MAG: hypothetical protein GEU96_00035 [Propionibacteriales bacterium]|nr:hypothetical protein [Propionibacteriales bacterium]
MSSGPPPDLAVHPCQTLCAWSGTGERRAGKRLFACSGCGSEWVVGQGWTPADADGTVAAEVRAELDGQ